MNWRWVLIALSIFLAGPAWGNPCIENNRVHGCYQSDDRVAACEAAVNADPLDFDARLSLCQAYSRVMEYQKALHVTQGGVDRCQSNREICQRLQRSLANIEELIQKQSDQQKMAGWMEIGAAKKYCLGPIVNERAIELCELAVRAEPENAEVLAFLARKQAELNQPVDALMTLAKLEKLPGKSTDYAALKKASEDRRRELVRLCLSGRSLETCAMAYLPGAEDAWQIDLKRFRVLEQLERYGEALELLAELRREFPQNKDVAQAAMGLDERYYASYLEELRQLRSAAREVAGIKPPIPQQPSETTPNAAPQPPPEQQPARLEKPSETPVVRSSGGVVEQEDLKISTDSGIGGSSDLVRRPFQEGDVASDPPTDSDRTYSNALTSDGRAY